MLRATGMRLLLPRMGHCGHGIPLGFKSSTRNALSHRSSPAVRIKSSFHQRQLSSPAVAANTSIPKPTNGQLFLLGVHAAIPMVGFGLMDNIVMITAGDLIDNSLGVKFGLSTLTAAGFGQCVSDVAGVTTGGLVDSLVARLNIPGHELTTAQRGLRWSRVAITVGGCIGVLTGCLLGMGCLFFIDTAAADRQKKANELTSIFKSVMEDGHVLVNAERATIWIYDKNQNELWSRVATGEENEIRTKASAGVAGYSARHGETINIHDAYQDDRFNPDVDRITGFKTKSIIAVPVKNDSGQVIAVIQMINKKNPDMSDGHFDENDVKLLTLLSHHVNTFVQIVEG